jgi:hypothetical protein
MMSTLPPSTTTAAALGILILRTLPAPSDNHRALRRLRGQPLRRWVVALYALTEPTSGRVDPSGPDPFSWDLRRGQPG